MSTAIATIPASVEKIVADEYRTLFAIPVTLRQVERAGIELDGNFGCDEAEHAEMLDQSGLLRLVFGVSLSEDSEVSEEYDLLTFESRHAEPATWHSCLRIYQFVAGHKVRSASSQNMAKVKGLLAEVFPSYQEVINDARAPFDQWVAESNEDAGGNSS